MKKIVLPAVVALFIGCIPSPTELCKSNVETTCKKMFECYDQQTKDFMAAMIGTSVEECKTKLAASAKCDSKTTQDDLCKTTLSDGGVQTTGAGKFDLGKAASCSDKVKAQSCTDWLDVNKTPDDCKNRCG